uniref:Cyclic AMP-dependent transcription factor ATF-4 n=1 Tax=Moschus moschiferus TaxID=68415 RepID=A0A8C6DNR5_MOSMO
RFMSIESVIPSSHLILCCPLLLPPPTPPSIRVFSSESTLHMRWPKYWSFSFSISPSNEHPGLISFRMDWLDLLACIKEEDAPSDNESGICMNPDSSLGSPQHSPSTSRGFPNKTAKVKGEKLDKKLKKMEQNKTAATRYRQKKRAEQEALNGECKELEKKNEALKEKADSLAKEIQYLKDLIEEVCKAREKKTQRSS